MKKLLEKLEALVDEATSLMREERQRRALRFMTTTPGILAPTVNPPPWIPFEPAPRHPDLGPEITWGRPEVTCAPPPFMGSTVTFCEITPSLALYGNH